MKSDSGEQTCGILVTDPVDQALVSGLQNKGYRVDYKPEISSGELMKILHDYCAVVVRSRTKLTSNLLHTGKGLKLIARAGIGTDNIDMNAAKELGIRVITAAGSSTQSVAELNLALLIDLARKISYLNRNVRDGRYKKSMGIEIAGKTAGVIGFGRIGFQTAFYLNTLGLKILAYDIKESPELISRVSGQYVPLDTLLEESDFIIVSVTLVDRSEKILGEEQFGKIRKDAILINTSRAEVVDPDALVSALKIGNIAAYGADVLWNEPPDSPVERDLIAMDNVLITPHIGAQTEEAQERVAKMMLENILKSLEELDS